MIAVSRKRRAELFCRRSFAAYGRQRVAIAALHESGYGRYCCKSTKLGGDNFPAVMRSDRRAAIFVDSTALARSLTRLSSGDEVPHIFTRKSRVQPGEFLVTSGKRLLQQYRHQPDVPTCLRNVGLLRRSRPDAGMLVTAGFDPTRT